MGKLIKITREEKKPEIICPHCKKRNVIDILPWREDVTKIMQDKCRHCRGNIVVAMLLLGHKDVRQLGIAIQTVIQSLNTGNLIQGS